MRFASMGALLFVWGSVTPALALEVPGVGLVYNTRENSSISYTCKRTAPNEIECELNQTAVRKKAKASELAEKLAAVKKEYATAKAEMTEAETCNSMAQMVDILEGRAKPPKGDLSQFTAIERKDTLELAKAFTTACKSPSEDNFLAVVRLDHERQARTCFVSSNAFKQKFRPAKNSSGKTWVQIAEPEGECGIVQLNRFEAVERRTGSSIIIFWKYLARKVITNPNGMTLMGSCSQLDQSEYEYDWREAKQRGLGCDYITFSPI
jgi:hypothetical protein